MSERRNGYTVRALYLRPEGRSFTAQVDKNMMSINVKNINPPIIDWWIYLIVSSVSAFS